MVLPFPDFTTTEEKGIKRGKAKKKKRLHEALLMMFPVVHGGDTRCH